MIPSAQSTRSAGQYFSTVDRQASTLRLPPESAGHFGDHFDEVELLPLVVVVVSGCVVVVVSGCVVVVTVSAWVVVVVSGCVVVVAVCGWVVVVAEDDGSL